LIEELERVVAEKRETQQALEREKQKEMVLETLCKV
jgi:hypothetical protein